MVDISRDDDFSSSKEPFKLFDFWFKYAVIHEMNYPEAMSLATVDEQGMPNVRMVLLKERDEHGFVFYTNYKSRKGQEILSSMKAAICFHWKSLHRQILVRGLVEKISDRKADVYYASRHRKSQIGAWASQQSRRLENDDDLEKAIAEYTRRYAAVGLIPRPPYWSGFRIRPLSIEFWYEQPFRLHKRRLFSRSDVSEKNWNVIHMYP
ncbi:MAG: pyridoxamine 5'-phosphate oxidase [Candidatus Tokpelaia sp. JSC161]|nr:MAG: pyridoxamine 5'-phosphate oxidase [Candidatus Tokpelaia sp. JSC161]